jgi:membrane protein DedA with SNARE-associated domain
MFARHGGKVVFFARFFTLLRALGAFLAGLNGMSWLRFAVFNAAGATLWACAFGVGAYLLGDQAHRFLRPVGVVSTLILVLAALAGATILLRRGERRWEATAAARGAYRSLQPSARKS